MAARAEPRPQWRGLTPTQTASLGIFLGCFAFLLALPPITARAPWWPALVGIPAVGAGIWAVTSGVKRLGWLAGAAGVLGDQLGERLVGAPGHARPGEGLADRGAQIDPPLPTQRP